MDEVMCIEGLPIPYGAEGGRSRRDPRKARLRLWGGLRNRSRWLPTVLERTRSLRAWRILAGPRMLQVESSWKTTRTSMSLEQEPIIAYYVHIEWT